MSLNDVPLYYRPSDITRNMDEIEKAALPLWKNHYPVRVRQRDLVSDDEIKAWGMFSVGDAADDKHMQDDWVDTQMLIVDMVNLVKVGKTLILTQQQDTKHIFDLVDRYLTLWRNAIAVEINIRKAPIMDLIHLAEFAVKLYPFAATMVVPTVKEKFFNFGSMGHSRRSLMADLSAKAPEANSPTIPLYDGHVRFFQSLPQN